MVKRADRRLGVTAMGNTPQNAASITLNGASTVNQGAIVLVSDCIGADLFQNRANNNASALSRGAGGDPGNVPPANDFSHAYLPGMDIYTFSAAIYYIGQGGGGEPTLFRRQFLEGGAGQVEELVEGVENMQVLFGEDTDADRVADVYVTSDAVTDWARIVSMKVGLLMRTPDEARRDVDTATYAVLGTVVNPQDARRVRRVVTSTIALRNRVP